jgi:hypothetical protein
MSEANPTSDLTQADGNGGVTGTSTFTSFPGPNLRVNFRKKVFA